MDWTFGKSSGSSSSTFSVSSACADKVGISVSDNSWITASIINGNTINATVRENTSVERNGYVKLTMNGKGCENATINIFQQGDDCGCANLKFNTQATVQVGTPTEISVITASCVTITSILSSSEAITANYENEKIIINATAAAEGTLTVSSKKDGEDCPSQTINVTATTTCDCTNDTITAQTQTWVATEFGTDNKKLVFEYAACCEPIVSSDTANFASTTESGKVYVYPTSENTDTENPRTASVKLKITCDGKQCEKTVDVTQSKAIATCECSDLKLGSTSITLTARTTATIPYTAECATITSVSSSDSTVATVNTDTSGVITIVGLKKGTATITVEYKAKDDTCPSKTISVNVVCPTITITFDKQVDCNGGTVIFTAS